jgi:hypothetical protein
MKEIKQIIELLEMNMQIMSQIPSVMNRTQEAISIAKIADRKLNAIQSLIDTPKYATNIVAARQIQTILEA